MTKGDVGEKQDDHENEPDIRDETSARDTGQVTQQSAQRPSMINQWMHDFQRVSQMLQAAIASQDAVDDREQERIEVQAAETLSHLRTDLERAKGSEEQLGLPLDEEGVMKANLDRNGHGHEPDPEVASLLRESQIREKELEGKAGQLQQKLDELLGVARAENERISEALGSATSDHDPRIDGPRAGHDGESSAGTPRLEDISNGHPADLQGLLADNERQIKELTEAHQSALAQQERLSKARSELEELLKENKELLEEQKAAANLKIAELLASHEHLSNNHASEVEMLKEEHENFIRVREMAHTQKFSDLTAELVEARDAASARARDLETLQQQISSEHAATLAKLAAEHATKLEEIRNDTAEKSKQRIQALEAAHSEEIETFLRRHSESLEEQRQATVTLQDEIAALNNTNNNQVGSLAESLEAAKAAADDYRARIRQLEAQSKSDRGDLQAAKMQSESLRHILRSMEQEGQEKEKEHADAVHKLETDVETAVFKLSEQSSRMMLAHQNHGQALERQRATLEQQHAEILKASDAKHAGALDELTATLEQQRMEIARTSDAAHIAALEALRQELEQAHKDALHGAKSEHETSMENLQQELHQAHEDYRRQTKSEHEAAMHNLTCELTEQNARKLAAVQSEHEMLLKALQADLEHMKAEAAAAQKAREAEHQTLMTERDSQHNAELNTLREQHAKKLQEIEVAHESTITQLVEMREASLRAAQSEHEASVGEVRTALQQEIEAKRLQWHQQHQDQMSIMAQEHARALAKQQAEHESTRQELIECEKEKQTMLELSRKQADELVQIKEQLDGALLEVETQRNLYDDGQEELRQLKQKLKDIEDKIPAEAPDMRALGIRSRSPRTHASAPNAPVATPGAGRQDGQNGLEASRQATLPSSIVPDEGEETRTPQAPDDPSNVADARALATLANGTGAAPSPSPNDAAAASNKHPKTSSPRGSTAKKRAANRNVQGQLAAIQQHVKQLDAINAGFLAENEMLARMLSRVDSGVRDADDDDDDGGRGSPRRSLPARSRSRSRSRSRTSSTRRTEDDDGGEGHQEYTPTPGTEQLYPPPHRHSGQNQGQGRGHGHTHTHSHPETDTETGESAREREREQTGPVPDDRRQMPLPLR